jgi:hypothetical protein
MKLANVLLTGRRIVATAGPPPAKIVSMFVGKSDMDRWCWASISAALQLLYQDTNPETQCQVASRIYGNGVDCCTDKGACDEDQYLSDALGGHHRRCEFGPEARTLDFVVPEIVGDRVVPIRLWRGSGEAGHYIVICGYALPQDGRRLLYIWDPHYAWNEPLETLESELQNDYEGWQWHYSYLTEK